ncbi:squalene synthase, partial [Tanacetum coccineum]
GLARSMPTSGALDRVAEKLNLPFFEDLRHKDNSEKALECLNDMVTNSLRHMEVCLKYMSDLHDPSIFRFCVIPRMRKRSTQNELATVIQLKLRRRIIWALLLIHSRNTPIHHVMVFRGRWYLDTEFRRLQARDMLWSGPISNTSLEVVQREMSVEFRAA